ncbi:MAG: class I SAM-dependent methyltransferase, partial [Candidatus Margulisbacteria bacterium]|nr:class I SAM-dependent methyltransferase [Candidatus Margulisiibacteriota bacterium]
PKRYLEVGSGVSTYYAGLAAAENKKNGAAMQITCIEPYPHENLKTIPGIKIHETKVENVDRALFQELQANDVLFIDSSHILKINGDVSFLYLEVLPVLNKGVIVHIHDIPFPYNIPYPPEHWIFEPNWPVFWNEAMVLQAFLCCNEKYEIKMSLPLIRFHDEAFLKKQVPIYQSIDQEPNACSSIWLRKVA